jgi:hypothetical protein
MDYRSELFVFYVLFEKYILTNNYFVGIHTIISYHINIILKHVLLFAAQHIYRTNE